MGFDDKIIWKRDSNDNIYTNKCMLTVDGGYAIKLTNNSGVTIEKGRLVDADTSDLSFKLADAGEYSVIGISYESIDDGQEGWIVIFGIADVLMEDNTSSTAGNWVKSSDTEAGYANSTNLNPPGGGIPEHDQHFREIGHCLESVSATGAGTHITAKCLIHFN